MEETNKSECRLQNKDGLMDGLWVKRDLLTEIRRTASGKEQIVAPAPKKTRTLRERIGLPSRKK